MEVVNLFAYRTSKPSLLKKAAEPIGRDNYRFILESVNRSDRAILAWAITAYGKELTKVGDRSTGNQISTARWTHDR